MTECRNYRDISLLSVVGKIYAEILVDRVHKVTEGLIDDRQGEFRAGSGYVDQIFTLKQIGEKAWEKNVYDRVNREALCQVQRMYDVGSKLLNGIKSIYVNSLAYVRVKGGKGGCFRINNGVRQGCIMSPWLFNVYMDALMKEMKMGMGRRGGKRVEVA